MPIIINGKTYYRTSEVYKTVGIGRTTLLRWLERGIVSHPYRDRRGWRLFTQDDLGKIQEEASKIITEKEAHRIKRGRGNIPTE